MSGVAHRHGLTPPVLWATAGLLTFVLSLAAFTPHHAHPPPDASRLLAQRDFRLHDADDGSVRVLDAANGTEIAVIAPTTNGFFRATMRGLARARTRFDGAHDAAFHLAAWSDGRLTLDDPVTRREIDLEAFGRTNAGAFTRLLPPAPQTQASSGAAP